MSVDPCILYMFIAFGLVITASCVLPHRNIVILLLVIAAAVTGLGCVLWAGYIPYVVFHFLHKFW